MKYGKECVCGRGGECQGVSAAFALLKDPRRGYVQLPQHHANPRSYAEKDMNAMRAAYLRHLRRTEESLVRQQQEQAGIIGSALGNMGIGANNNRWFVALHHFHPVVVQKHSEMLGALSPIPKTLKKVDLKFLNVALGDEDRVRDEDGRKRKVYYFCPSWPMDKAKEDLKRMIRISRLVSEASASRSKMGVPNSPLTPNSINSSPLRTPLRTPMARVPSMPSLIATVKEDEEESKKPPPLPSLTASAEASTASTAAVTTTTDATAVEEAEASSAAIAESSVAAEPSTPAKSTNAADDAIATTTAAVAVAATAALAIAASIEGEESHEKEEGIQIENDKEVDQVSDESLNLAAIAATTAAAAVSITSKGDDEEEKNADAPVEGEQNSSIEEPAQEAPLESNDGAPGWATKAISPEKRPTGDGGLTVITTFTNATSGGEENKEKPEDSPSEKAWAMKAASEERSRSAEIDIDKVEATLTSQIFEQQYDEEKLPSNMTMESEEGRKFLFRRMSKFESKRQATSGELVGIFAARWRASLEIMQAGIFEMARAERVVRGAALANKAYADAMQAMYDDVYLDSEGKTVLEQRKQKRLAKEREGEEYTVDAGASPEFARGEAHTRSAMLGSMVDSQAVIAEKFADNSDSVLEQVVTELYNLRAYLKQQMIDFKRRGDPFIRDIQDSETEIRTAFAVFELIGHTAGDFAGQNPSFHSRRGLFRGGGIANSLQAVGSFHGTPQSPSSLHGTAGTSAAPPKQQRGGFFRRSRHGTPRKGSNHGSSHGRGSNHGSTNGSNHGNSSHGGVHSQNDEQLLALDPKLLANAHSPLVGALRSNTIVRDGWLIEMLYRQAVNSQVQILQKCGGPLEKIWKSMQNIEVNRQIRLHEVLLDFMPRQRRLFLGLSPIAGPILNDLVETRKDPKELEEQVEETVRKHMQVLLKSNNAQRSSIMNRSRATVPNLDELHGMLTGEFFDNGLLRAAKIVERRAGIRGHWQTTLVVVTSDKYLHLFDLTNFPQVFLGGAPEPVFEMMLPDYDLPSLESDHVIRREHSLLQNLTPVATVHLVKCAASVSDEDPRTMDILESGLTGLLRSTRTFTLRTTGREETKQWVDFMVECQGDSTPLEPNNTPSSLRSPTKGPNIAAPEASPQS